MKNIDDFSIERLKEISEFESRKTTDGFDFYPEAYSKVYSSEIVGLATIVYEAVKSGAITSHGIRIKGKTE